MDRRRRAARTRFQTKRELPADPAGEVAAWSRRRLKVPVGHERGRENRWSFPNSRLTSFAMRSNRIAMLGIFSWQEKTRTELRIPDGETSHDDLLTDQLVAAVSYVSRTTGRTGDDLLPLRAAVVSFVREQYDGYRKLPPDTSGFGWMDPYRSYKA